MKLIVCIIVVLISATIVISQTTSGFENPGAEAETEGDVIPESETIPIAEHVTNESTSESHHWESDPEQTIDESKTESEGQSEDEGQAEEEEEAYHEDTPDDWDTRPENNPVVENGFVNLPFYDFDGPVPDDYFIPAGERPEPAESNPEPEDAPEYWWENEPEYFYDDEYAYLKSLAAGRAEPEAEVNGEKRAEPEGEIEPEYGPEPEANVEPEFKYLYTFKREDGNIGTKKILRILIAILSVLWSGVGGAIVILTYKGHVQYREAKLEKLENHSDFSIKRGIWKCCPSFIYIFSNMFKQPAVTRDHDETRSNTPNDVTMK